MPERVRVGVVGTSWWADLAHLPGLRDHPGAEIAAICGRNRDRAEEMARKYGIPRVYTDYRAMMERGGLQALLVLVPDDLHHPIVMDALDARLHVLCEKPLALTVGQARAMYERAEAAGVRHMINYTYRWMPPFIHLRDLIAQGYVGRCYHCELRFVAGYARDARYRWRFDRRRALGTLGDLGSHLIDLAHWYLGDMARVSAHLATAVARQGPEGDGGPVLDPANDSALLAVEFRDGTQGAIHASAVAHTDGVHQEVALYGDGGTLSAFVPIVGGSGRAEIRGARAEEPELRPLPIPGELWGDVRPERPLDVLTRHSAGARAFVDAILADRPASPSFHDGLKAQEVIEAALTSHEQGRWVAVGA